MGESYYLESGKPYDGPVFESQKGIRFGEMTLTCPACGGSGRSFRSSCRKCGGSRTIFDQVKVYDEAGLARLIKDRARRRTKKQEGEIARQEAIDEGHATCVAEHADLFARAEKERGNLFLQDLIDKSRLYGGLNDAQVAAMRRSLDALDVERARYAASRPLGQVGDSIVIEAECVAVRVITRPNYMKTDMVDVHVHELMDENGSAILFSASKPLLEAGERVRIEALIAKTDDARGYPRTMLSSPKNLERLPASAMTP